MQNLEVETIAQRLNREAHSDSERALLARWFDDGGVTARQEAWETLGSRVQTRPRRYVW